jgi:hypothetical protein
LKEARGHCLVKQWFCSIKTARTHFRRFNLPHNMADQDQAQSVPHEGIDVAVIHYLHWALQSWNALARMLGIAELRGFRDGNGNAQWPFYYSTADDVAPERAGSAPARLNESLRDVFNSKREERSGEERDLPHLSHNQHANEATSALSNVQDDSNEDEADASDDTDNEDDPDDTDDDDPDYYDGPLPIQSTPQTAAPRRSPRGKKTEQK